ncbi:polymorphic toxin-type HINT domain-containing protein [Lentzea sp. NPDC004789]
MKRGPIFGAPVMMAPDESYAKAVANWATYLCRSSNPGAGFCEWSYTVGNRPANGWDFVFTVVGAVGLAAGAVGGSALRGAGAASKEAGWLGKAAKVLGNGCGGRPGNSFAGDTQVLMADGSIKRIDEIKVGDHVLATDPETGESGAREVTATIIGEGFKNLVEIETADGKIVATDKHPFWLPDQKRWVDAKDLHAGLALQTSTGTRVEVTQLKERVEFKRVRNLSVDGIHTYYVLAGDTPVLVHNDNGGIDLSNATEWQGRFPVGGALDGGGPNNGILYRTQNGAISNYAVYDSDGIILRRVDLVLQPHGVILVDDLPGM